MASRQHAGSRISSSVSNLLFIAILTLASFSFEALARRPSRLNGWKSNASRPLDWTEPGPGTPPEGQEDCTNAPRRDFCGTNLMLFRSECQLRNHNKWYHTNEWMLWPFDGCDDVIGQDDIYPTNVAYGKKWCNVDANSEHYFCMSNFKTAQGACMASLMAGKYHSVIMSFSPCCLPFGRPLCSTSYPPNELYDPNFDWITVELTSETHNGTHSLEKSDCD